MWLRFSSLFEVVCLLCLSLATPSLQARCYGTLNEEKFPGCQLLDNNFALHWSVSNDSVTYGIEIDRTSGWFALGVSEGGGMRGGDIWIFSKGSSNEWGVNDYFATDYEMPTEDTKKDVTIQSAQQSGQSTVVVFSRKLETCDYENDQIIYPQQMQAYIHAYADKVGYHGTQNRGTRFVVLNSTQPAVPVSNAAGNSTMELPLLMPNITVPTNATSYLCTTFEAPSDKRYQIIGANYSITPNKLVHHMLLSVCSRAPDQPVGSVYECVSGTIECSYTYLVWVPGQSPEVMPVDTGFPFGKDGFKYFMLQIHYTNPDGVSGVKDNTGFVPLYTSNLRKHDLGLLWVGSEGFDIPPGEQAFSIPPSVCPAECTEKLGTDLNMDKTIFHMHQLGAKQAVQHLRKSPSGGFQEIVPLNYRDYYDYDWQGSTFIMPGGETLLRGDALITTCTFNSVGRKTNTSFGAGSFEEMCYNFIRYWPAQKIDRCIIVVPDVNGTGVAQCGSTQEFAEYLIKNKVDDFTPELVVDLIDKGFFVLYNASQYRTYKPYNRVSATCAATINAPPALPPSTATPSKPGTSSQVITAPGFVAWLFAAIATAAALKVV